MLDLQDTGCSKRTIEMLIPRFQMATRNLALPHKRKFKRSTCDGKLSSTARCTKKRRTWSCARSGIRKRIVSSAGLRSGKRCYSKINGF